MYYYDEAAIQASVKRLAKKDKRIVAQLYQQNRPT